MNTSDTLKEKFFGHRQMCRDIINLARLLDRANGHRTIRIRCEKYEELSRVDLTRGKRRRKYENE